MVRPQVEHDGFLVPNAAGLSYPRMSEVDQIDFNTLSNVGWSVIEGCLVTVTGTTATVSGGGTVIVDGSVVTLSPGATAQIGTAGAQDRFDLVVATQGGALKVRQGTPSNDPTLPDPQDDETTLAAVFVPSGTSNFTDFVIDKRVFAPKALLTKRLSGDWLVRNTNGAVDPFTIKGDGEMAWETDTLIRRVAAATLEVVSNLITSGDLTVAGDADVAGALDAAGLLTALNLKNGTGAPGEAEATGTVYQDTVNGRLYIRKPDNTWSELASVEATDPVGSVKWSIEVPAVMNGLGYIQMVGQTVAEGSNGGKWDALFNLSQLNITGTAPNRSLTLPDMRGKVPVAGDTPVLQSVGSDTKALTIANLPPHKHNTQIEADGGHQLTGNVRRGGAHGHVQLNDSGKHGHPVNDPGHRHYGMDFFGNPSSIIAVVWGGTNKLDALFNDRNHTYSVEPLEWIAPAETGITIGTNGGAHKHVMKDAPDHDHALDLDPIPDHGHVLTEQQIGSGTPIDVRQAGVTFYCYLKA